MEHTLKEAPLIRLIRQAAQAHYKQYGFHAEKLHASTMMEGALVRWAESNKMYPADIQQRLQGAEIFGMQVVRMTKNSALVEFYLSSERDGQLYTSHAILEPETVGIRKVVNTNNIILETDNANEDAE